MVNRTIANSLNLQGIPLNSTGVVPVKKPKLIVTGRPPTPQDNSPEYYIGTIWVVLNRILEDPYQIWYLADNKLGQPGNYANATWLRFTAGIGPIEAATEFPTDNGTAFPDINGILNVFGGDNINTAAIADGSNNLYVNLDHALHMPATSADGTQGIWYIGATGFPLAGGALFISALGTSNTFAGQSSGNLTLTTASATNNSGFGRSVLTSLTTGANNLGAGSGALFDLTTGSFNVALGVSALASIDTQHDNTAIGYHAMQNSTASLTTAIGNYTGAALTANFNTLVGQNVASAATTSTMNTSIGYQSSLLLTTGNSNTIAGYSAGNRITSGSDNVLIGSQAGISLASSESDNIYISHSGVVTENNTTRIGSSIDQTRAFMGGIYGVSVGGTMPEVVVVDEHDQLGTASFSPGGIKVTIFTTSGTWNADAAGPVWIKVIGWNGGGGGGGSTNGNTGGQTGSGGGAGGCFIYEGPAALFGSSQTVTVGAGGAGGPAGQTFPGKAGGDGGITSFGYLNGGSPLNSGGDSAGPGQISAGISGDIWTYGFAAPQSIPNGAIASGPVVGNTGGSSNLFLAPTPGGCGGIGSSSASAGSVGYAGGSVLNIDGSTVILAGGTAGAAGTTTGTAGGNGSAGGSGTLYLTGGTGGGGGGGANSSGTGGAGGAGAIPGGAGGGGGSGGHGNVGGAGARGQVQVYEYF